MKTYEIQDWDQIEASFFGRSRDVSPTSHSHASYNRSNVSQQHGHSTPNSYAYGSVAVAYEPQPQYSALPMEMPERMPKRQTRRPNKEAQKKAKEAAQARRKLRQERILVYKNKEKRITWKRFREAFLIVLAISSAFAIFSVVLYRQSQIATVNFQNNSLQRKITLLEQETSQMQEELMSNTDLAQIQSAAMEKLGMQMPGANQALTVELPKADHLVTNNTGKSNSASQIGLAKAKENLAQYYLSLK